MAEVNLQQLLEAASGERIGRQSDSSSHFMTLADRVFLKTLAEVDPTESAATRQVMMREAPIERAATT